MLRTCPHECVEWTSELQGEHHQASNLCRRCHRYLGKGYRDFIAVLKKSEAGLFPVCITREFLIKQAGLTGVAPRIANTFVPNRRMCLI